MLIGITVKYTDADTEEFSADSHRDFLRFVSEFMDELESEGEVGEYTFEFSPYLTVRIFDVNQLVVRIQGVVIED